MTIGLNETLNKLGGVDKDKFAKKDEFTTQDFSSISKQFSNIFNTQFNTQFQNQFDYKQVFSNGSNSSNFMSKTTSRMSDEKYSSQSYNLNAHEQTKNYEPSREAFEQKTEAKRQEPVQKNAENSQPSKVVESVAKENPNPQSSQVVEQAKNDNAQQAQAEKQVQNDNVQKAQVEEQGKKDDNSKAEAKKQAQASDEKQGQDSKKTAVENVQQEEVQNQILATLISTQQVVAKSVIEVASEDKKTENPSKAVKLEKAESSDSVEKTSDKLLVNVKATELQNVANVATDEANLTPKVDVDLKDVKIEKLDVKTKQQVVKQDKETPKQDVETNKKAETTSVENPQNKVSLERLVANVVSENPEAVTELDKLLNKDIIKKADTSAKNAAASEKTADKKIQMDFNNTLTNNQSFSQNQNFGQANQDSQAQLKANLLASNMTLGASLQKNNFQGNVQMDNLVQSNQANNMLEKNIFDQVMNKIQGNISAQKSEVTMILKPENLGKVTLNIMNEKGTISAEFKAETKQAVESLSKNIEDLKETLKQQGVICTNLVVKLEEPKSSENNQQFAQDQNKNQNFKDFSQDNAQNSGKDSWENKSNNQTVKNENNQNIQVEQEQPNKVAKDQGLVDYRV